MKYSDIDPVYNVSQCNETGYSEGFQGICSAVVGIASTGQYQGRQIEALFDCLPANLLPDSEAYKVSLKQGRPPTGAGKRGYIRAEHVPIIDALAKGDKERAIALIKEL